MSTGGYYPQLPIIIRRGEDPFTARGESTGFDLLSYWQWSASNLLDNTARGILAEFLVAQALGVTNDPRREWDAYDLTSKTGTHVEVKSSAYLQSWHQNKLSDIQFNIAPTQCWNSDTNERDATSARQAHVYVFCLLDHKNKATVNPMELTQWRFFVLPTLTLDEKVGAQKKIGLRSLESLSPHETDFEGLSAAIEVASGRQ